MDEAWSALEPHLGVHVLPLSSHTAKDDEGEGGRDADAGDRPPDLIRMVGRPKKLGHLLAGGAEVLDEGLVGLGSADAEGLGQGREVSVPAPSPEKVGVLSEIPLGEHRLFSSPGRIGSQPGGAPNPPPMPTGMLTYPR